MNKSKFSEIEHILSKTHRSANVIKLSKKKLSGYKLPDFIENIQLVKDHFRKPEWKKAFKAKLIDKNIISVDADIYVWDNNVGICSFEGNKFKTTLHSDRATFQTYRSLLEVLWEKSRPV